MQKRIPWVDNCKAMAISSIVLGHLQSTPWLSEIIFEFILTAFFFVSGFTFARSAETPFPKLIRKKFHSLIVPYFGFSTILFAFWFLVRRNFGLICQSSDISSLDIVLQILCGVNSEVFITPLWFLTCLFMTELFFWGLLRLKRGILTGILITVLFVLGIYYLTFVNEQQYSHIFWNLDRACFYLYFLAAGFIAAKYGTIEKLFCSVKRNAWVVLVFVAIFTAAFVAQEKTSTVWLILLLKVVMFNTGLLAFIGIAKLISQNKVLDFIGQNTLTILALHMIVQSLLRGILFKVFHIAPESLQASLGISVLLALITLAALVPAILLINRFIPRLAGKFPVANKPTP